MKAVSICIITTAVCILSAAEYKLEQAGPTCRIYRNGRLLVDRVNNPFLLKQDRPFSWKADEKKLPDGSRVFNFTSTDPRLNYRMEIALLRNRTEVEISASARYPAYSEPKKAQPMIGIAAEADFIRDSYFDGYMGTGRSVNRQQGNIAKFPKDRNWRFLTVKKGDDSILFDLNPVGAGDYCSCYPYGAINGVPPVEKDRSGRLCITYKNTILPSGGMLATKIRIKDGTMDTYKQDHALLAMSYVDALKPLYLLSFGSAKHGKFYTAADTLPWTAGRNWGWIGKAPEKTVRTASGAYYSHLAGQDAVYRLSGLPDGLHLVTVGAGNPAGTANRFSVTVNGQTLLKDHTVAKDRFMTATLPIWVDDGRAELKFTGKFIVSAIADQFLMSNREDFQCRRGFWVTEGHEPSVLFRNSNYRPYAEKFKPSVKTAVLPQTGKESAGKYREFNPQISRVNFKDPKNFWLFNTRFERIGTNSSDLNELTRPEHLAKTMDDAVRKNHNTIMFSGMHSRHTFPKSRQRTIDYTRSICAAAHRNGLKVIEHHDATLLWNTEAGFRTLAERIGSVNRSIRNQLPGLQLCILDPEFTRDCMDYLKELVRAGIDGLQLDELNFYYHAGGCPTCREQFHKDTGWYLPVDETHPFFHTRSNEISRAFFSWKLAKKEEWKENMRRELWKINPNLAITGYGSFALLLTPEALWTWNSDLMRNGRSTSLMGKECQSPNVIANNRMFMVSQKVYNYFRYAFDIPVFTWLSSADWQTSYYAYAVCQMLGQLPLDYGHGFSAKSPVDFIAFDRHPDRMNNQFCRELSQVAILYSYQSLCQDTSIPYPPGPFGFAQTLDEMHVPYQFLGDDGLTEELLKPFKVLYVGSASCLRDDQIAVIRKFAENGGRVILSGFAGARDEIAKWRKPWPFADIMGFSLSAKAEAVSSIQNGKSNLKVPAPVLKCAVPVPSVETIQGTFRYTLKSGKSLPGVIAKKVGKGVIVYSPVRLEERAYAPDTASGKVAKFVYETELLALLRKELGIHLQGASLLTTNAPMKVPMTLFREKDQILVHLINGQGGGLTNGKKVSWKFYGNAFPAIPEDITFTVPYIGKNAVFAVSPDFKGRKALKAVYHDNGTVTVTLPKELLKTYTLVRIQ